MKTFIALVVSCWIGAYAWAHPVSSHHASRHVESPAPALETSFAIELPTVTVVGRPPTRKVVAPSSKPGASRAFVCGEMHDNWQGGRNADCFWR